MASGVVVDARSLRLQRGLLVDGVEERAWDERPVAVIVASSGYGPWSRPGDVDRPSLAPKTTQQDDLTHLFSRLDVPQGDKLPHESRRPLFFQKLHRLAERSGEKDKFELRKRVERRAPITTGKNVCQRARCAYATPIAHCTLALHSVAWWLM